MKNSILALTAALAMALPAASLAQGQKSIFAPTTGTKNVSSTSGSATISNTTPLGTLPTVNPGDRKANPFPGRGPAVTPAPATFLPFAFGLMGFARKRFRRAR